MDEITKKGWVWDEENKDLNLNPLLVHRYHREGWCISEKPYGLTTGGHYEHEGNPNDFYCELCDRHFRRVAVTLKEADYIKTVTEGTFDGQTMMRGVDAYPLSTELGGCNCITNYEHERRGEHAVRSPMSKLNESGIIVPLVRLTLTFTPPPALDKAADETVVESAPLKPYSTEASTFLDDDFDNPFVVSEDEL
jgi:hypothetical protein